MSFGFFRVLATVAVIFGTVVTGTMATAQDCTCPRQLVMTINLPEGQSYYFYHAVKYDADCKPQGATAMLSSEPLLTTGSCMSSEPDCVDNGSLPTNPLEANHPIRKKLLAPQSEHLQTRYAGTGEGDVNADELDRFYFRLSRGEGEAPIWAYAMVHKIFIEGKPPYYLATAIEVSAPASSGVHKMEGVYEGTPLAGTPFAYSVKMGSVYFTTLVVRR